MPMDFPDMKSLISAAKIHEFRKLKKNESEIQYCNALANHVQSRDYIESEEIRNGIGWDKWDEGQNAALIGRSILKKNK